MHTGVYWQIFYWFSTPILGALAVILPLRRLHREFPLFTFYVVVAFFGDLFRLSTYPMGLRLYTDTFWITQTLNTSSELLACYELCMKRLFAAFYKVGFYRSLFPAAALMVAVVSIMTALNTNRRMFALVRVIHVLDALQVTLLLFFVGLMIFMGRGWGRFELGIACGLGLDAAGFVVALANLTRRTRFTSVAQNFPVFAYNIACFIWLATFCRRKQDAAPVAGPVHSEALPQARKWEETLKDSLAGKGE